MFNGVDEINEMKVAVNPDLLAIMLLYTLPPSFENFRSAIDTPDKFCFHRKFYFLRFSYARRSNDVPHAFWIQNKSSFRRKSEAIIVETMKKKSNKRHKNS